MLQEYNLRLEHVPGLRNVAADALSRQPVDATTLYPCAEPHVVDELTKWLHIVAPLLTVQRCVTAGVDALEAGCRLSALRCTHCAELHLDEGSFATRKHVIHTCQFCTRTWRHAPAVCGNPLAMLGPHLADG